MGRGYSFDVIRARMLYEPKARKGARCRCLSQRPRLSPTTFMDFTSASAIQRPVRMQRRTVEYGTHIPTLVQLLEAGHFELTSADEAC